VSTPLFIRESQLDKVQLKNFILGNVNTAGDAYRERFGARMRDDLGQVGSRYAVFSPYNNDHGEMGDSTLWSTITIGGRVMRDAVSSWYKDPCNATHHDIQMP
jgi:hypothetical protein